MALARHHLAVREYARSRLASGPTHHNIPPPFEKRDPIQKRVPLELGETYTYLHTLPSGQRTNLNPYVQREIGVTCTQMLPETAGQQSKTIYKAVLNYCCLKRFLELSSQILRTTARDTCTFDRYLATCSTICICAPYARATGPAHQEWKNQRKPQKDGPSEQYVA